MIILLDLDGVLADFNGAACGLHGRPKYVPKVWDYYADWGYTASDFWRPIERQGACFYPKFVRPYPWMRGMLHLVQDAADEVIISTANPLHSGLIAGKVDWIKQHVGDSYSVMFGHNKELMAGPERMLIDDCDLNIAAFRNEGGYAITFPQPWNKCCGFTSRRLEFLKDSLDNVKGELYGRVD